jgi:GTPase
MKATRADRKILKNKAQSTDNPRERAFVLVPVEGRGGRELSDRLREARGLAEALDLDIAQAEASTLRRRSPRAFLGEGRIDALKTQMEAAGAHLLVIDCALSPVQQRNLEAGLNAKVLDRTGLILEIFGRRARSREGVLQVELARQAYERSRLVRTWTHLERQRGGLGKTGGPGETQLEIDRRLIADRIDRLKRQLEEVRRTRGLQRRARVRAGLAGVALVGYTNAGKSTLFNRLTHAGVFAEDMPFATLDPTARLIPLPGGAQAILSDTVGFIADLPTELVESFRATLEEVTSADVLVHVRDIAHPETEAQREDVLGVLDAVFAGAARPPVIEAWNKIDQLNAEQLEARLARAAAANPDLIVPASALTGQGVEALLAAIEQAAYGTLEIQDVMLNPADGRARAALARTGRILSETLTEDGQLRITLERRVAILDAPIPPHGPWDA